MKFDDVVDKVLFQTKKLIFRVACSKFMYPSVTLIVTCLMLVGMNTLMPMSEIEKVGQIIEFLKIASVMFISMTVAGYAQAMYPYGKRPFVDPIFNGICGVCTVCAAVYSVESIFQLLSLKTVMIGFCFLSAAVCLFVMLLKDTKDESEDD